jgi:hypothetical protein
MYTYKASNKYHAITARPPTHTPTHMYTNKDNATKNQFTRLGVVLAVFLVRSNERVVVLEREDGLACLLLLWRWR